MSRAEVRRSLLAIGVHPRVVDAIVAELPAEPHDRSLARGAARGDDAERAAASVIADFERLLSDDER